VLEQHIGTLQVGFRRMTLGIHAGVEPRAQATAAAPDLLRLIRPPFPPELCYCARTKVAAIVAYSAYSLSASCARACKPRYQTPLRLPMVYGKSPTQCRNQTRTSSPRVTR